MTSSIDSTRLQTSQIFMKVMKEEKKASGDTSDEYYSASIDNLQRLYGQDDDSTDADTYSPSLLSTLSESGDSTTDLPAETSDDIQTSTFMTSLKRKLEEMQSSADGALKAKEMLAALEDGTLTITDAPAGLQLTAWDPDGAEGDKTATQIATSDWSSYLKSSLGREKTGGYALTESGAHIDKTTGNNASFFSVDDLYVYATWPTEGAST